MRSPDRTKPRPRCTRRCRTTRDADGRSAGRGVVERAGAGNRSRDHRGDRRGGGLPGTPGRERQPHRTAGIRRERSVSSLSGAACHGTQRATQRRTCGADARGQGTPRARRHERQRHPGAHRRYDASRLAAAERAALPSSPDLGRFFHDWDVLLCPADHHRGDAPYAGRRDVGTADGDQWP